MLVLSFTCSPIHLLTFPKMLSLETHPDGVILSVKAVPGAKKNEIRDIVGGMLKVCCTQVPEKGKANKAILGILAKSLSLRKSQISLFAGETDSHKKFLILGISPEELSRRVMEIQKTRKESS